MTLNQEMVHHLRALTRFIYVVTDEEDVFIQDFGEKMAKHADRIWVFNAGLGLLKIKDLVNDWKTRAHQANAMDINAALVQIYKDDPRENEHFYLITDPEVHLDDAHIVRRVLNIAHQLHQDIRIVKCIIFIGSVRFIPRKLARYIEVVNCHGMPREYLQKVVTACCEQLQVPQPEDIENLYRGFTSYEVEQASTQSVVDTLKDPRGVKRIDPDFIAEYRRKQIRKTDLVQIVDTKRFTFDSVGGVDRFKEWAKSKYSCWTEEGRNFGLRIPRGVLLMGVYGCGKSLSAKALASEWHLPLVQLEMGKLRSSAVGQSESNLYGALRIIESVAPCAVWIDEAEKSLAGGQSSAQSDAGTTSRMLGIMLTWVQEVDSPICLILTANSLKNLPPEIVNRLPDRFFFEVPDLDAIVDILKIHCAAFSQDVSDFNLGDLAKVAQGLVGREIEQCVESAMVASFNAKKRALDEEILKDELKRKSRITLTMTDDIKELTDWVGYNPELDDGVKAQLASRRRGSSLKIVKG